MLSAPVFLETVDDESAGKYLAYFKEGGFGRVFFCGFPEIDATEDAHRAAAARFRKYSEAWKAAGLEVGIWLSAFGHGGVLAHAEQGAPLPYGRLMGPRGGTAGDSFCPLDPDYREAYCRMVAIYAEAHPDLLMLDDDFRLSTRPYGVGCYCPLHLAEFERRAGKKAKNGEELFRLAFLSEDKTDRETWLSVLGDSLYGFAAAVRRAVDGVDPAIRCGVCMCMDTWDESGTDAARLARIFAGETRPFLRTIGAPYWHVLSQDASLAETVEYTRLELSRQKEEKYRDIEMMAEGDVYPRYRTQISASLLELYHGALIASGNEELLKYVFDYSADYGYEEGYREAHLENAEGRNALRALFAGKTPVGIRLWEAEHRIASYDFSASPAPESELLKSFFLRAARLFSAASVPTSYGEGDLPLCVLGESARTVPLELFRHGAIIDKKAAELLAARGLDTGLLSAHRTNSGRESFGEGKWLAGVRHPALYALTPKESALPLSHFEPEHVPSSYLYESEDGHRFFVLGYDAYAMRPGEGERFLLNYYRTETLKKAVEWLSGKALPAHCRRCPSLYLVAAEGDGALSVGLFNMNADFVYHPEILLGKEYASIRFEGTAGTLQGRTVALSSPIPPFSYVAFEVRK
jgi:hypothetical protein